MNIGAKLTAARKIAGLTQEKLAERLDVTPQAISTWERNENLPDTKNLFALAKILKVSLDELVSDNDPPSWELRSPIFYPEHMYTYVKAKAQVNGLTQTLAALPLMRAPRRAVPLRHVGHPLFGASTDPGLPRDGYGNHGR